MVRSRNPEIVIVDRHLRVAASGGLGRELLATFGARSVEALPPVLDAELRTWLATGSKGEFVSYSLEGMLVRATTLDDSSAAIAMLLERVESRETLAAAASRFGLSARECDVLRGVLDGLNSSEIAALLEIGEYTVGDYVKRLFAKTDTHSRPEMIARVLGWQNSQPRPFSTSESAS